MNRMNLGCQASYTERILTWIIPFTDLYKLMAQQTPNLKQRIITLFGLHQHLPLKIILNTTSVYGIPIVTWQKIIPMAILYLNRSSIGQPWVIQKMGIHSIWHHL